MQDFGEVREVDLLGRLNLPTEIRKKFEWDAGDTLSVFYDEKERAVLLRMYKKHEGPPREMVLV